jgi:hypothetical protein
MEYKALPMDLVRLIDGKEAVVNSAHYIDLATGKARQMFSVCEKVPEGEAPPLYFADECELIHRHDFRQYGPVQKCDCGAIYTTMDDYMTPRNPVTYQ